MWGQIMLVGLFALLAVVVLGSAIWSDLTTRPDEKYKYH